MAFRKPCKYRRADHVQNHECHRQDTDERELGLEAEALATPVLERLERDGLAGAVRGAEEAPLDRGDYGSEDLTVDVVEEVDEEKENECAPRAGKRGSGKPARLSRHGRTRRLRSPRVLRSRPVTESRPADSLVGGQSAPLQPGFSITFATSESAETLKANGVDTG